METWCADAHISGYIDIFKIVSVFFSIFFFKFIPFGIKISRRTHVQLGKEWLYHFNKSPENLSLEMHGSASLKPACSARVAS